MLHFDVLVSPFPVTFLWVVDGESVGTVYSLPVLISGAGLSPGDHFGIVRIQDNGLSTPAAATNSPLDVPVTVRVLAGETSPPSGVGVSVNHGTASTNSRVVELGLSASDSGSGMGEMRLSNDGVTWSEWMPFSTTKTWELGAGTGTKTVRAKFRDKLHNESGVAADSIFLDVTAPSTAQVAAPAYSTTQSKTKSVVVKWAATDVGLGVAGYDVDYRTLPSSTWTNWGALKSAGSAVFTGTPGRTYQFRVRARDKAGNDGSFSAAATIAFPYDQTAGVYAGSWSRVSQSNAFLGSVKSTKRNRASVTFTATGRSYSVLVTKGAGRSRAKVYVDGVYVKRIDTRASSTKYRQRIFLKSFASSGSHKVRVVNYATAGRTRLQVDGLAVMR